MTITKWYFLMIIVSDFLHCSISCILNWDNWFLEGGKIWLPDVWSTDTRSIYNIYIHIQYIWGIIISWEGIKNKCRKRLFWKAIVEKNVEEHCSTFRYFPIVLSPWGASMLLCVTSLFLSHNEKRTDPCVCHRLFIHSSVDSNVSCNCKHP